MSYSSLEPLFAYAGGKRRSLRYISRYLKFADTYVEPFFGAGAVFCHMVNLGLAKKFIINDIRKDIMGIYRAIRDDHVAFGDEFLDLLERYRSLTPGQQEAMFIEEQDLLNTRYNAAKFLFIRKSDHGAMPIIDENGNSKSYSGHMRNPNKTITVDREQIQLWKDALDRTDIYSTDFEGIQIPKGGTNVFCDPPYYATKIKELYGTFTKNDQNRCLNWCNKMALSPGICVLLSNRDYENFFSEKVGRDVEMVSYNITYSSGDNAREKESLFIWNKRD